MSAIPATPPSHAASASAIGYIYQIRYSLLEALRRLRQNEQFTVSIETLDDVVFERAGNAFDLLQTKHHCNRAANLTDASSDIWKTIRIWSEGITHRNIPEGSALFLVTTSAAPDGSIGSYLASHNRDEAKAVARLNATAESSTSEGNRAAYTAYLALDPGQREELVRRITIIGNAPDILQVDDALKEAVFGFASRDHLEPFLQRLEGWWLRRALIQLTSGDSPKPILSEELDAETARLREQFKQEGLPIDDEIMQAEVDATGYQDMTFVHQLRLISIGNPRILRAIRNYFRAFEQRSRWMREDLLLVGELDRYEDRLIEEWDILFEQMRDELGEDATEAAKKESAQALYRWVETNVHPTIRAGVTEPSISRGSYQMLSDKIRLGWHIDYADLIKGVLDARSGGLP